MTSHIETGHRRRRFGSKWTIESDGPDARRHAKSFLDRLRDDAGWPGERELILTRLVERFPAKRLVEQARLGRLDGGDAEAILRLVEAFGDERLFVELAEAIEDQPDLPAEQAWRRCLCSMRGMIEGYPRPFP